MAKVQERDATRYNNLLDLAVSNSNAVIASGQYALFGTASSNALGGNSTVLGDSAQKYLFILENPKSNPASLTKSANHEYILSYRYDDVLKPAGININHQLITGMTVSRKFTNMYLCKDGLPIEKSPLFQGYATWTSEFQNRDRRQWYNYDIPYQSYWSGNTNYRIDWTGSAAELLMPLPFPSIQIPDPAIIAKNGILKEKWQIISRQKISLIFVMRNCCLSMRRLFLKGTVR